MPELFDLTLKLLGLELPLLKSAHEIFVLALALSFFLLSLSNFLLSLGSFLLAANYFLCPLLSLSSLLPHSALCLSTPPPSQIGRVARVQGMLPDIHDDQR